MKKILLLLTVVMFFGFKSRKEIDENKMNRDLEIAKNILSTLIQGSSDSFFGGSAIEASYIRDYGVVFTIPEHLVYFHFKPGAFLDMPEMPELPEMEFDFQDDFNVFQNDINVDVLPPDAPEKAERKQMEKREKEIEKQIKKEKEQLVIVEEQARKAVEDAHRAKAQILRNRNVVIAGADEAEQINWEEIIITFMTDYADLIGQLNPDEKIVIKQKTPYNEVFVVWNKHGNEDEVEEQPGGITGEVLRKDIEAYKSGKIDKDELIARISIEKKSPPVRNSDLEMFTSIFDRYYSGDLSETYYAEGKPSYEMLKDFGATVYIRVVGPGHRRLRFYTGSGKPVVGDENENEQNEQQIYQAFKESVINFMLDYGRTVRSLDADDKLRLEIKINSCRDCQVPKLLEVSADIALLEQYDQQKISKAKALAGIETGESY